jgi:hypothetical protein
MGPWFKAKAAIKISGIRAKANQPLRSVLAVAGIQRGQAKPISPIAKMPASSERSK